MELPGCDSPAGERLVELASGIDALYLSGRADLPEWLIRSLERARSRAETAKEATPIWLGHEQFWVGPRAFGLYRFCLLHPYAQVGVSPSGTIPAFWIQFRSEFLHGAGVGVAIAWISDQLESVCGAVELTVSRLDLHADFQGWALGEEDLAQFLCRARSRTVFEEDGHLTGIQFGRRKSKTIGARIYDKTAELGGRSVGFWEDVWGARFEPGGPVVRVEFELWREALKDFGVRTPDEALAAAGALWDYVTRKWLSLRIPTEDGTKARWPVAPVWQQVQRAGISDGAWGIERMYEGRRRKGLRDSMPYLVGYLTSFAARVGTEGIEDTCEQVAKVLDLYGRETRFRFPERISKRRGEMLLP